MVGYTLPGVDRWSKMAVHAKMSVKRDEIVKVKVERDRNQKGEQVNERTGSVIKWRCRETCNGGNGRRRKGGWVQLDA